MPDRSNTPPDDLLKNPDGTITVEPLAAWAVSDLAGTGVLLSIRYLHRTPELKIEQRQVQLGLTAQHCQELAEVLQKRARILLSPSDKPVN